MSSLIRFGLIVAVLAVSACQKAETPPPVTPADPAASASAAIPVRAGSRNLVFEARTSREIRAAAGTTLVLGEAGSSGAATTVIAQRAAGELDLNCGCPGGCSPGDGSGVGFGCSVTMSADDPTVAVCGGDCSSPNASCMGCSFEVLPLPPSDPRAEWLKEIAVDLREGTVLEPRRDGAAGSDELPTR